MSEKGHSRRFDHVRSMSALARFADLTQSARDVREVPEPDMSTCSKRCARMRGYSITSSARASTVVGISRPSALAVLRLITNSYLFGACTGRSAGFSPLRMRSI
jgi:hypothetical protein